MKTLMNLARQIVFICIFFSAASAIQAEGDVSPPANMPFKFGLGHGLYQQHCASCHGGSLEGSDKGPPLLHGYYNPSHHGDMSFYRAIRHGSKQHHWNFGDMPPVPEVGVNDAGAIVEFVRWLQSDAGLF